MAGGEQESGCEPAGGGAGGGGEGGEGGGADGGGASEDPARAKAVVDRILAKPKKAKKVLKAAGKVEVSIDSATKSGNTSLR